jgi:hypothetical protein
MDNQHFLDWFKENKWMIKKEEKQVDYYEKELNSTNLQFPFQGTETGVSKFLLSGKCKQDFYDYCVENKDRMFGRLLGDEEDVLDELSYLSPISVYPLVIEFLDIKKYKEEPLYSMCFGYFYKYKDDSQSQIDIWIRSIEESNKIYNANAF